MPIGVIVNALSVVIGGLVGAVLGNKLSGNFKEKINMIFGCCSMAMGISTIVLMQNMPAVVFSVIIGTGIGLAIHLGDLINKAGGAMQRLVSRFIKVDSSKISKEEFDATLLTVIVLFCASGTGIYGSLVAGMSGDHSVLFAKSILDLFTALIFACTLGAVVSVVAIPQFIFFVILFALGGVIIPHTTPAMIADFKACGGFLMLATGFRMIKVKMFPIADMLPAMVLVMPISLFWVSVVTPAVAALAG
ncbi:MAG: DUF554 domain-containing protein [Oscillospiraceae bacterium]|nr:DUF554 domain-containing protein [Oscillospiraceae bacterium]